MLVEMPQIMQIMRSQKALNNLQNLGLNLAIWFVVRSF